MPLRLLLLHVAMGWACEGCEGRGGRANRLLPGRAAQLSHKAVRWDMRCAESGRVLCLVVLNVRGRGVAVVSQVVAGAVSCIMQPPVATAQLPSQDNNAALYPSPPPTFNILLLSSFWRVFVMPTGCSGSPHEHA
jgi:hypothetical protein